MEKIEHPTYATCTGCTQVKGVDKKTGRMKQHKATTGGGNAQWTIACPGSLRAPAEANGQTWDGHKSAWVDLPLEILTTMHDLDGQKCEMIVESHAFVKAKTGLDIFTTKGYSAHLYLTEKNTYGDVYDVELRDATEAVVNESHGIRDDGHLNGLMLCWLEWLADGAKGDTR